MVAASTRRVHSAVSAWPGWRWVWTDASVSVSEWFVERCWRTPPIMTEWFTYKPNQESQFLLYDGRHTDMLTLLIPPMVNAESSPQLFTRRERSLGQLLQPQHSASDEPSVLMDELSCGNPSVYAFIFNIPMPPRITPLCVLNGCCSNC